MFISLFCKNRFYTIDGFFEIGPFVINSMMNETHDGILTANGELLFECNSKKWIFGKHELLSTEMCPNTSLWTGKNGSFTIESLCVWFQDLCV